MEQQQKVLRFFHIAEKIYAVWKCEGILALEKYFREELRLSWSDAILFSRGYAPEKPPTKHLSLKKCPYKKSKRITSWIFKELSLQLRGVWPKNILAWQVFRFVFGDDFDFQIIGTGEKKCKKYNNRIVFFSRFTNEAGEFASFGLIALGEIEPKNITASLREFTNSGKFFGPDLAQMLIEADFILPDKITTKKLLTFIQRGVDGEEIVLTGVLCPDYSYEKTNNPHVPFRYTFRSIKDGVGLVAMQFQRVIPFLVDFFKKFKINYRIVLTIGDFEANSEYILRRVGVSREEFIVRCAKSLETFRQSLLGIPMDLLLFEQEWDCGQKWGSYVAECFSRLSKGDFGNIQENTGRDPRIEIEKIAISCKNFYNELRGRTLLKDELFKEVIQQGAEYAAMGRILKEEFEKFPFLQIAGDRERMQLFNSMHSDHPTICTKRVY